MQYYIRLKDKSGKWYIDVSWLPGVLKDRRSMKVEWGREADMDVCFFFFQKSAFFFSPVNLHHETAWDIMQECRVQVETYDLLSEIQPVFERQKDKLFFLLVVSLCKIPEGSF